GRPRRTADADRTARSQDQRGVRDRAGRAGRRIRPRRAGAAGCGGNGRVRGREGTWRVGGGAAADPVRTADAGTPCETCGEGPETARQGQPAGVGGVRRAGGALQVPVLAAGGPETVPAGSGERHQGGRREDPGGVHQRLRGRGTRVPDGVRHVVPRRGGAHGAHRPGRHAHHRRGRGGQTAGQEGQTVVVALRWGEVAGRGRYAGGDFPGPAVTVLRARRGGGRARRDEHAAV